MEERRFRWSKIIVDWFAASGGYKPSFAREEITSAVTAIHGIGAHVAVRTQSAEAGQFAVEAGADSIEQGMHLPRSLLPDLASYGGILVPTGDIFVQQAAMMADPRFRPRSGNGTWPE